MRPHQYIHSTGTDPSILSSSRRPQSKYYSHDDDDDNDDDVHRDEGGMNDDDDDGEDQDGVGRSVTTLSHHLHASFVGDGGIFGLLLDDDDDVDDEDDDEKDNDQEENDDEKDNDDERSHRRSRGRGPRSPTPAELLFGRGSLSFDRGTTTASEEEAVDVALKTVFSILRTCLWDDALLATDQKRRKDGRPLAIHA